MKGKDIRMICRLAVMDRLLISLLLQRGTGRHVSRSGSSLICLRRGEWHLRDATPSIQP